MGRDNTSVIMQQKRKQRELMMLKERDSAER